MQYAPTHTDQKSNSHLLGVSETCQVFECMSLRLTQPRQVTLKICMGIRETRRGSDGCDQCHATPGELLLKFVCAHVKPARNWTNMAIFTENPAGMGRIWPYLPKTRRGLDEYGQCYAKPARNWTNMAIFTENPPGIGRIWPFSRNTRRGLDEYGYIYRKPGEDGMNMAIFMQYPPRIGRIWSYSPKTRRGLNEYGHIYAKPAGDGTNMATAIKNSPRMG